MNKLIVIAIGGNSLIKNPKQMSVLDQYKAAGETVRDIAPLIEQGYRVVITHGNGPQVGFILLRSELAREVLHQVPLANCVADTQGSIGFQIQQCLGNELQSRGIDTPIATVVTQVVVDKMDPALLNPAKPIGPFYTEHEARNLQKENGWDIMEDAGRGWRRVVASPQPVEIVEEQVIRKLLDQGVVVIACGGGGIPVTRDTSGLLKPVAAVIDKDTVSSMLASNLQADKLIISTAVDRIALNFNQPNQSLLDRVTLSEIKEYLQEGHFAAGSMKPKVEAAIRFLENGGKEVIITLPDYIRWSIDGTMGTHVVQD